MNGGLVWNLDPVFLRLGPVQIRYYGLVFVATLLLGFWVWRRQMLRGGYAAVVADRFLIWGTIATLAGARLGHCFFYEPQRFMADPVSILFFWQGGLASHGALIGLILALFLFARRNRLPVLEVIDRFAMSAAVGSAGIRLGNFLNSEIVGRATNVPWAVRFIYYDHGAVARHPSQLYEFFLGVLVLLVLYLADRWGGTRAAASWSDDGVVPDGLLRRAIRSRVLQGVSNAEVFHSYDGADSVNPPVLGRGWIAGVGCPPLGCFAWWQAQCCTSL